MSEKKVKRLPIVKLYVRSAKVDESYNLHWMNLDDVHPDLIRTVIDTNPMQESYRTKHLDTFVSAMRAFAEFKQQVRLIERMPDGNHERLLSPDDPLTMPECFKKQYTYIKEWYE